MGQASPISHHQVAVIGGGQAGLSISWFLVQSGIEHVVFERQRAGHGWRAERWRFRRERLYLVPGDSPPIGTVTARRIIAPRRPLSREHP